MPVHITPRRALLAAVAIAVASCKDQAPLQKGPPYLAILPRTVVEPGASLPPSVQYRVRMLSEPSTVDTTIVRAPLDTIIVSLPPATYSVELEGLPGYCSVRDGTEREALLLKDANTSIVRYSVGCRVSLTLRTVSQAQPAGTRYVVRVSQGTRVVRDAVMAANDSLPLDALQPGLYAVELRNVPEACANVSDGGRVPKVNVTAGGGAEVVLRVDCARISDRPQVVTFGASYRSGTLGFYAAVTDPNRDVNQYSVDLTDCQGATLLPRGARTSPGLARTLIGPDTVFVIAAFEPGIADSVARNACASFRAVDLAGNSSALYEVPLATDSALAPQSLRFNAIFNGTSAIVSTLVVSDPDDDFAGAFLAFTLRDGAVGGTIDGKPEYGIYSVNGVRGTLLPVIPLGAPYPDYADYVSVIVYLIDKKGHVTRLVDSDLFR